MVTATFQFHNELNDFLPRQRRQVEFSVSCARKATTKHMIEALGVPHTEVELITVHGEAAGLDRLLSERDRVAVYPRFKVPNGTPHACLRQWPLDGMRFIVDVHLGGLARHLRMAGFDTVYRNDLRDAILPTLPSARVAFILSRYAWNATRLCRQSTSRR